ncbi:sensor histidine kinase, partial [Sphaerochaeta sp.]|uniref:sensor histidine kinase n=1 Tax=Sphaerochaeta sp. TaxID=1972642 RepID=UPI00258AAEE2
MRKQFVRLFLSFVLVLAVVLGIQGIVVVASLQNQRTSWTESVFQEYLDTFTANLRAGLSSTPSSFFAIEQLLLVSADDRVSGLYIRNPDGTVAVAYGNTSSGNSLPIPRPRPSEGPMTTMHHDLPMAEEAIGDQGFTSSEMHSDVYVVKILQSGSVTSLMVSKQSERQKQTILLPPQVKANDIAGSLVIMYNNEVLGMVDVLTYTPFTYKNTGRLFKGLLYPFLWAMPFAFIIALLMAASVSRRSQRYTSGIQAALQHLSSGENGVELPSTKIDEQKVINASIRQLDENLLLNKVSRQAWLRSISHDLNTPVASMKLLLDGMSDGVFPVTEQ